jgi:hypothetical protein
MEIQNGSNAPTLPTGQLWVAAKTELSTLEKYLLAFKQHERLLIVLAILAFGTFGVSRWLNYESAQKDAKVAALTLVVAQDKASVQNLALQAQQAQATYQTTLDAITKENSALAQANAQQLASLAQRQTGDKQLPLPQLGQRLQVLVPAATGVTATSTGLSLDSNSSVAVVQQLEQVPVLIDELKNETQVAANDKSALDAAGTVIVDKTVQIAGLNKSLTDQQAHEVAAVAAEKVKTKKAFWRGFKYGFVTGFGVGAYIVHAL